MTNREVVDFSQARKRLIGFSDGRKCLLEMLCYPLGRCWRLHKNCQKKRLFQDMITAYLLKGSVVSVFQIIQLWISWCQLKQRKKVAYLIISQGVLVLVGVKNQSALGYNATRRTDAREQGVKLRGLFNDQGVIHRGRRRTRRRAPSSICIILWNTKSNSSCHPWSSIFLTCVTDVFNLGK